jgi:hypothetical protein
MSGLNFNASANYSVQQRYQATMQGPSLDQTIGGGLDTAAILGGPGFGPQLGSFASSFSDLRLNPFSSAGMQFGGMQFGGIGAYGAAPSPAAAMAYQSRYSGMQFAAGGMSSFRGGVGSAQFGSLLDAAVQPMAFERIMAGAQDNIVRDFGSSEIQGILSDSNASLRQRLGQLAAAGAPPSVLSATAKLFQMNAMQESFSLMSKISQFGHGVASSIIQNLKA